MLCLLAYCVSIVIMDLKIYAALLMCTELLNVFASVVETSTCLITGCRL